MLARSFGGFRQSIAIAANSLVTLLSSALPGQTSCSKNIGYLKILVMCGSREYPYLPHGGLFKVLRGRRSLTPKFLTESMRLNWNFQRVGGGGFKLKNPCGRSTVIPWNNIIRYFVSEVLYGSTPVLNNKMIISRVCQWSVLTSVQCHKISAKNELTRFAFVINFSGSDKTPPFFSTWCKAPVFSTAFLCVRSSSMTENKFNAYNL